MPRTQTVKTRMSISLDAEVTRRAKDLQRRLQDVGVTINFSGMFNEMLTSFCVAMEQAMDRIEAGQSKEEVNEWLTHKVVSDLIDASKEEPPS